MRRQFSGSGPQIPAWLLRDFEIVTKQTKDFLQDQGGVFVLRDTKKETIKATLLPVSNEDIRYLPEGTISENTQKLYTNGTKLKVNQTVTDCLDRQVYKVITELTHGPIHPLKRYIVNKEGVPANG